jgi:NAD dependent epimerase/dehydratase
MDWGNQQCLVTGAGGFIGSHLVQLLLEKGARVRAFVHYNSRNDPANLKFLDQTHLQKVEIVMGDVQDPGCVDRAVAGCDCIFHLAALIGIPYSYVAPRSYVSTNIIGTLNVLEAARHHNSKRVIQTSTSEVYGTALYEPIDEKHPLQGQSPYSASKIGADKLAESYHSSFGLPLSLVRPFNTYGPRQSARAIIPTIINQLLAGKDVIELGSLEPKRDFTFVQDTVRGFVAVAESEDTIGETINLGSNKAISMGELANLLVEIINPQARIKSTTERSRPSESEVMNLLCDSRKAKKMISWESEIYLKRGLGKTIEFIRSNPGLFSQDQYVI